MPQTGIRYGQHNVLSYFYLFIYLFICLFIYRNKISMLLVQFEIIKIINNNKRITMNFRFLQKQYIIYISFNLKSIHNFCHNFKNTHFDLKRRSLNFVNHGTWCSDEMNVYLGMYVASLMNPEILSGSLCSYYVTAHYLTLYRSHTLGAGRK